MALGRSGLGKQEALHLVTAGQPQQDPLVLGFNALDQHRQAERAAKRHNRLDDHATVGRTAERRNKALVDLELVEGKALEVTEIGIAGPEIVESDAHAQVRADP